MDVPAVNTNGPTPEQPVGHACHTSFLLDQIQVGHPDKLGNLVQELLWYGRDYIIYRTCRGVFINFSDCSEKEREQRTAFTQICPELCELRFLTHEMRLAKSPWYLFWRRRDRSINIDDGASSLFDHNIAQSIMLLMEKKYEDAREIAEAALKMAVTRSTNDNTIRYVGSAMKASFVLSLLVILAEFGTIGYPVWSSVNTLSMSYFIAALFGILGAAFSVITRVQSFQMKPCQQSNMNYLMAWIRIGIGLISGLMLYLFLRHPLGNGMISSSLLQDWGVVAIVGFLGGFAERLVPTVFQGTATALENGSGTPVQEARRHSKATIRGTGDGSS